MFDHVHVTQTGVCLYKILNKSIAISSMLQPLVNDEHTKMKLTKYSTQDEMDKMTQSFVSRPFFIIHGWFVTKEKLESWQTRARDGN